MEFNVNHFNTVQDIIGCVQEINFLLWPRNDIDKIICLLFSRWKGDENSEYRLIQVNTVMLCIQTIFYCCYSHLLLAHISLVESLLMVVIGMSVNIWRFGHLHVQLCSQNAKVNRCHFHYLKNGLSLLQFFPSFLPIVGAFWEDESFWGYVASPFYPLEGNPWLS